MSGVLSYLNDPNGTGVYCASYTIRLQSLLSLLREISANSGISDRFKLPEALEHKGVPAHYIAKTAFKDISEAADYLSIIGPETGILAEPKILPVKAFKAISTEEIEMSNVTGEIHFSYWSGVLLSANVAFIKTKDAIRVKANYIDPNLILDVASLKENGCKVFEEFIKSIPIVSQDVKASKISIKHSSRYCTEPMIASLILWMYTDALGIVPDDIENYFKSSITYYERNEWRISIILAAIAVESTLAEIYEEYFHKTSRSDPIGVLKDKIEKKQKFPDKVLKDIEIVNKNRISAVHRSSAPVGSKEARNVLIGATKFTHWAFSEGPLCI